MLLDASVHDQGAHFFDSQPANKVLVPVAGMCVTLPSSSSLSSSLEHRSHSLFSLCEYSCSGETALPDGELSNNMGRIAVLGDSSCLDDAHGQLSCDWLLIKLLKYVLPNKTWPEANARLMPCEYRYACEGRIDSEMAQDGRKLQRPLIPNAAMNSLPQRRVDSGLYKHSRVIGNTLPTCSGPAMSVGNSSIDISDILWQRLVYLSENIKQQPPPHDYSAQAKGTRALRALAKAPVARRNSPYGGDALRGGASQRTAVCAVRGAGGSWRGYSPAQTQGGICCQRRVGVGG